MISPVKLVNSFRWDMDEILGRKSATQVYDQLCNKGTYDNLIKYHDRVAKYRQALQPIQTPLHRVLDLACGTGAMIEALPENDKIEIVGTDVSQGMLDIAKQRFGDRKNVTFLHSDFLSLSFPHDSFDLITIGNAIRFVKKEEEAEFFTKIANWLTPNGTFVVIESLIAFPLHKTFHKHFVRGSNMHLRIPNYLEKSTQSFLKMTNMREIDHTSHFGQTLVFYFTKV